MIGTSGRIALALGSISSPVMPGMLMSERIRNSDCSMVSVIRIRADAAEFAKSIVKRDARRSRRNCCRNKASTSAHHRRRGCKYSIHAPGICSSCHGARECDDKLGKDAGLGLNVDPAAVLFHHDVMAHREAEPGP